MNHDHIIFLLLGWCLACLVVVSLYEFFDCHETRRLGSDGFLLLALERRKDNAVEAAWAAMPAEAAKPLLREAWMVARMIEVVKTRRASK